ncbi:phage antirepressor KilAC domain-containing protein [Psychrobacillus sp.]|uniref:phage antirepressor KilAC domain-containing protein n=1 Tax=Psychrobacillus sp. TaxID=1871623 RepID=UPI0028BECEB9|nr:phage antirepressor KilAC domain-containing protein [Psychrobacillus sp.]
MNQLIETNHNDSGEIIISGRELHKFLESNERYSKWFSRMLTYGFVEGVDFTSGQKSTVVNNGALRTLDDHELTIDMAKEISMIQRNERGAQARRYFLQVEKMWNSPEMIIKRAHEFLEKQVLELQENIDRNKSKVFFAEAVEVSKNAILVKDLATLLKQNGIDIGQNRLFEWLRNNDYLCAGKTMRNKPTQRAMDMKLFEISTHLHSGSDGEFYTKYTPKVTGKGQAYFINKLLNKEKV